MAIHPIRKTAETALARFALAVIPALPRPAIIGLSRFFAASAYVLSHHLRRVGWANLDLAYGTSTTRSEKRRILQASFQNFALMSLDSFWFSRDPAARMQKYMHFEDGFHDAFCDKPQICITAHLGNWEVLGLTMVHQGIPMLSVAAPLANPDVDAIFNELRARTGQRVVSKHGVIKALLKELRHGGKVALLLDQNTRPDEGGAWVDFFKRPVSVSNIAGTLHERTRAEVLFGACLARSDGHYFIPRPEVLVAADAELDSRAVTEAVARATERWIQRYPDKWLWTYKRWKYVPPGWDRSEYPFYAKSTFANATARTPPSGD